MTRDVVNTVGVSTNGDTNYERWVLERASGAYRVWRINPGRPVDAFMRITELLSIQEAQIDGNAKDPAGYAYSSRLYVKLSSDKIAIYGHVDTSADILSAIEFIKPASPASNVLWWTMDNGSPDYRNLKLTGNQPVDEFYPWMPKTITQFAKDFMAGNASVLLLFGPPGTGKTSFIRGLVRIMGYETWVSYDHKIQEDEGFYVDFMKPDSGIGRCLVLEDSDALISKRSDGNAIMNRILNVSDGIVSLPDRKIIFSTNLPGLKSIDDALLRPGRCFAAIRFRSLTRQEAITACAAVGRTPAIDADHMTLSEAMNGRPQAEMQVVGFTP